MHYWDGVSEATKADVRKAFQRIVQPAIAQFRAECEDIGSGAEQVGLQLALNTVTLQDLAPVTCEWVHVSNRPECQPRIG